MTAEDEASNPPGPVDVWVGQRLRSVRKAGGLTQAQVGEALGLTEAAVRRFERAGQPISAARLWRLCRLFEIDVSEFFDGLSDAAQAWETSRPRSDGGWAEGDPAADAPRPTATTMEIVQLVNSLSSIQQTVVRDMVRGLASGRRK